MKRFLFLAIILSCLCVFASCMGGGGDADTSSNTNTNTDTNSDFVCEHLNEEVIKGTPSTCILEGLSDGIKCADCGEILEPQATLPLSYHTEVTISAVSPTCEEKGYTSGKKCGVCDEILSVQEEIEPTGHTEQIITGKAASCLKDGLSKGIKCTVCKKTIQEQEVIPALGHDFQYQETIEPSCTYIGYDIYKCANFGCKETERRNETETQDGAHSYAPFTEEPTCTEAGYTDSVCEFCGVSEDGVTSPIQPLGHTYLRDDFNGEFEYKPTKEPTCITDGEGWIVCSDCLYCTADDDILNEDYKVTIKATGIHDFSDTTSIQNEVPPTCEYGGYVIYKCVSDPNCMETSPGPMSEPLGHSYVSKSGLAPTETERGYTEHEECTVCQHKNNYFIIDTLDTAKNIASNATITSTADWHAFDPSKLVDGSESSGTYSPKWRNYSVYFDFDTPVYVSYFNYICTGKGNLTYGDAVDELTYCAGKCEINFYDADGNKILSTGEKDTSTILNIDASPCAFVKRIEIKYNWASHAGNEYMWEVYVNSPDLIAQEE